ncbi:fido (protein-threonine AMPylation protein) [Epilithonimonas hungarica]|uniref:hypothetical protein n=1 Tax=Epilithonimonas hungarica TaxID=454006 RepID=UPI00277E187F|nr:hypothetical protein [Epilithonimonas hungarica]MDP9956843.1 fido (protein-threonine AMPylation protein) [Epilithonimonas hungarica]
MTKYNVNPDEDEILPNLLNSNSKKEIEEAEFEGFLYAEILLTTQLSDKTKFDLNYIKNIHYLALKDVYSFAGKYRTVNIPNLDLCFQQPDFYKYQ